MAATDGMRADWAQKDFYQVLGVKKDADAADIKKAYRKLARENHPDSNPGDEAKAETFKQVAEAYDVVGDPEKRKKYDEMRSIYAAGGVGGGFGAGHAGGFDLNDLFGDRAGRGGGGGFGDVFSDLFGGGGRQRAPRARRGQDVATTATISFTDAIDGVTISLRLTSDAACGTCRGTGGKPGTKPHVCAVCDGALPVFRREHHAFQFGHAVADGHGHVGQAIGLLQALREPLAFDEVTGGVRGDGVRRVAGHIAGRIARHIPRHIERCFGRRFGGCCAGRRRDGRRGGRGVLRHDRPGRQHQQER